MTQRSSQDIAPSSGDETKGVHDEKTAVHDEKTGAALDARPSTAGTGGRGALNLVVNPLKVRPITPHLLPLIDAE